jgi:RHS repeat-associated protein
MIEQQNFTNNLTYLRARYYHPALGRFLTPDSIIPDVTNGQSLNAYAYVYNDPINLVDPSGNTGIRVNDIGWSFREQLYNAANNGLKLMDWWYREPDDCSCQRGLPGFGPSDVSAGLGLATQGVWAGISEPAQRIGNVYITQARPMDFMGRTYFTQGKLRFPAANTQALRGVSIDQTLRGWMGGRGNTTYLRSGVTGQTVIRPTSAKWVIGGMRGLVGTIGIAGLIDGVFQLYSDLDLCLSHAQRFNRFALAFGLGTLAALGGAIVFGVATAASLPVLTTIALSLGASTIIGLGGSWVKEQYFRTFSNHFGI